MIMKIPILRNMYYFYIFLKFESSFDCLGLWFFTETNYTHRCVLNYLAFKRRKYKTSDAFVLAIVKVYSWAFDNKNELLEHICFRKIHFKDIVSLIRYNEGKDNYEDI